MRNINFINQEYYHIYNRGVDKRDIFLDENDYSRFFKSLKEFNRGDPIGSLYEKAYREKVRADKQEQEEEQEELSSQLGTKFLSSLPGFNDLVEFICYCLNPNHYHFILKQLVDDGISKFMHKLSLGYTNYFNLRHDRSGSLFQGPFKAVQIESFEHLLWLSVYVNTNAQIHGIIDDAVNYPWCSYPSYLGLKECNFCNKNIILQEVGDYKKIVDEAALFMKEKKEIEKYLIE